MSWKILLPLSTLVALANCGGRTLSPQESSQFLDLFRRHCSNSGGSSQEGNTFYYCKTSDQGPQVVTLDHTEEIQGGNTPKQVIFVQPPSYQYVHNVQLRGSPGNPQETDIYVLPPQADHSLNLNDARSAAQQPVKPSLYFLSDQQQQGGPAPTSAGLPRPLGGSSATTAAQSIRPSAPPPRPSTPNAIGINSLGGYNQPPQQQLSAFSQAYGAPSALSPRSRNLRQSQPQLRYSTL